MKYIKKYESFKNNRSEKVNEEFLGSLIGGIKNMFKKSQERTNKAKGGKEVEAIYQKYLNMITTELAKTAQIDLNVAAASKGDLPAAAGATTNDANAKLAVDTLKKKKAVMDQIVQKLKGTALKEMDAVLTKFGGAAANPQLKIIIDTKKDQFEMDYLNAQIGYLDKAGDKTMLAAISKERDALSKSIEADFKDFDTAKAVTYAVGDEVIYLLKDKKPEEYDKTKKPEDQKAIVGVHKIAEIDGDNFTLEDEKGEPTIKKTGKEIMGKVEGGEGADAGKGALVLNWGDVEIEIGLPEEGGTTRYRIVKSTSKKLVIPKGKVLFCDISGEAKKGEKVKLEKLSVQGAGDLKIDGKDFYETGDLEKISLEGKEVDSYKFEGAENAEGKEDLQKKLGDLKDKPEELKKVSNYVDFMSDEKNAAKVEEIEKIIGEGEEESK